MSDSKPTVLCRVHNAGRSQMAAGYLRHLAGGQIEVLSAGSAPADSINSVAVEAMKEDGVDITSEAPKILTTDAVQESDVVITMGCGDACPVFPANDTKTGNSMTRPAKASNPCVPSATRSKRASERSSAN